MMMMMVMAEEANKNERSCSECKTTKTPMWRGGPAGPKSLCNACGIRYRKQRRLQLMGNDNIMISNARAKKSNPSSSSSDGGVVKKQRRLREEEQAAFSLLALSCGSVFA